MKHYDNYINFIVITKICFILLAVSHVYLKYKGKEDTDLDKQILYWKERLEFIFIASMAILLIYLFYPRIDRTYLIDKETKLLLYLFGVIILITAKWGLFIKEAYWFKLIQELVGHSTSG